MAPRRKAEAGPPARRRKDVDSADKGGRIADADPAAKGGRTAIKGGRIADGDPTAKRSRIADVDPAAKHSRLADADSTTKRSRIADADPAAKRGRLADTGPPALREPAFAPPHSPASLTLNDYDDDAIDSDLEDRLMSAVYYTSDVRATPTETLRDLGRASVADLATPAPRSTVVDGAAAELASKGPSPPPPARPGRPAAPARRESAAPLPPLSSAAEAASALKLPFLLAFDTERPASPVVPARASGASRAPLDLEQVIAVRIRHRYFIERTMTCFNCGREGHVSAHCPDERKPFPCYLCGETTHTRQYCPQSLCHVCHRPGHQVKDCHERFKRRSEMCHRCQQRGHPARMCPQVWRLYRELPAGPRGPVHAACYHCGGKGHFGDDCPTRPHHATIATAFVAASRRAQSAPPPNLGRHTVFDVDADSDGGDVNSSDDGDGDDGDDSDDEGSPDALWRAAADGGGFGDDGPFTEDLDSDDLVDDDLVDDSDA